MSISKFPFFEAIRPYLVIEVYDRDGSTKKPRIRIECAGDLPLELESKARAFTMPCVACGNPIHPIRPRRAEKQRGAPEKNCYYAPTCQLGVKIGCSRGKAVRNEYKLIKSILRPDLL